MHLLQGCIAILGDRLHLTRGAVEVLKKILLPLDHLRNSCLFFKGNLFCKCNDTRANYVSAISYIWFPHLFYQTAFNVLYTVLETLHSSIHPIYSFIHLFIHSFFHSLNLFKWEILVLAVLFKLFVSSLQFVY